MATWEESKKIGEDFEKEIALGIKTKLGIDVKKNDDKSKFKLYDLILDNGKTIECKFDERAEDTKNFCIETHCDGNESGILTTSADYWAVTNKEQVFLIKISELKKCIYDGHTSLYPEEPTKFLHMEIYPVKQGDGVVKLMDFYTIPIHLFSEYCVEINSIDKMTYKDLK